MRVLITGGTGFIGSNLIPYLIHDHEVGVVKRTTSTVTWADQEIKWSIYDFSGELDCLVNILKDFEPDVIIHLATYYVWKSVV